MRRNSPRHYGTLARFFHWAVVILIIVTVPCGLARLMETTHLVLQFAVYALVAVHVAAALPHHLVRRDGLFARMWPARQP